MESCVQVFLDGNKREPMAACWHFQKQRKAKRGVGVFGTSRACAREMSKKTKLIWRSGRCESKEKQSKAGGCRLGICCVVKHEKARYGVNTHKGEAL